MEAPINNSEIVIPVVPSLLHFCLVKIAIPLFKSFDIATWHIILKEMKHADPARPEILEVNKAKEKLFLIPPHLRLGVLETIMGLNSAAEQWYSENPTFLDLKDVSKIIAWKTDGTVKRIETIHNVSVFEDNNGESMCDLASYFGDLCVYNVLGQSYEDFMSRNEGIWNDDEESNFML